MDRGELKNFLDWTKLKLRIHFDKNIGVFFQEREIWWASLGMNVGYEQNGKHETFERPILVLKKFNLNLMWIIPLTSVEKIGKYYYQTKHNDKISFFILSQLRLVSAKRLRRKIRTLPWTEFRILRKKIKDLL